MMTARAIFRSIMVKVFIIICLKFKKLTKAHKNTKYVITSENFKIILTQIIFQREM